MTVRKSTPSRAAPKVSRGDPIRARDANTNRAAIKVLQGIRSALFVSRSRSWAETMTHEIVTVHGDYLECVRVWRGGTRGTEQVFVARPQLLRRSITSRDGVSYTYTDDQTRTATKGPDSETQRVTPNYLVGDIIEVQVIRGTTGITEVDQQRGRPIDKNVDGRAWAAEPAP